MSYLSLLNLLFPPLTDVLVFAVSLVFATAAGVTAFLLLSSGNIRNFKKNILCKVHATQLPIVTPDGNIVDTKEDLEAHLEILENRLLEKVGEIASSKTKINDAKESIDKLNTTQAQVKKYYIKLKDEIKKSEDDCQRLQIQIDDYKQRRIDLEKEMRKNERYYRSLLGITRSNDSLSPSQTSSKSSLNSGDSSASSYYDSSSHLGDNEFSHQDNQKQKNRYRKTKTRTKIPALSKIGSKESLLKQSTECQLMQTVNAPNSPSVIVSKCSLPSIASTSVEKLSKRASDLSLGGSAKDLSRDNSKTNIRTKGSKISLGCNKSSSTSSHKSKALKGKSSEKACCCGSDRCTGTCNIARSLKLGIIKPKDLLSLDVAEHVDATTGKMVCGKDCPHRRNKVEDSRSKKSSGPKTTNKN